MKITCGCKVVSYTGIEYCPMHKTAPAMYEALKALTFQFAMAVDDVRSKDKEVYEQAQKALAKAEGG